MTVRLRILGDIVVVAETGAFARVASRRARRAMVALATSRGGLTSRELAERVWDDPPATWPAALRGAVASLRSVVEPIGLGGQSLIVTTSTGWAIDADAVIDLDAFEVGVARAEALIDHDAAAALLTASEAADGSGGDVLAGEGSAWIDALRRRRAALEQRALAVAADAALAAGRSRAAEDLATRSIQLDPLDESARRRRIRAIAAAGDRAGAIREFEQTRRVLADELGVDPAPETAELYLEILRSGRGPSTTLPLRPFDEFVGRTDELEAAVAALSAGRSVGLVGQGGIGKTRLALEIAHDAGIDAPGGLHWASLGEIDSPELVASAVAAALGTGAAADPLGAAISAAAASDSALLVLDGCERQPAAAAEIAQRMLAEVPLLRILTTSRTPVGVPGERRISVGPMPPGARRGGVIDLLRIRVAEHGGDPALGGIDDASLDELGRRLGGVPLAVELAAAQLTTTSVPDLVDELAHVDGALATLIEQSFGALDADEALLVRALGRIDGAVPLAVARRLIGDTIPGQRVARMLANVGEVGLVRVDRRTHRWRYGLDEHLREFARRASDETETKRIFAALADALDDIAPAEATAPPGPSRDGIDAALDGFRTLFGAASEGRAVLDTALDLAFRLHRYWTIAGLAEGRHWFGRLLARAESSTSTSASLCRFAAGYLAYWAGSASDGLPLLRRAADETRATHPAFATRALIYAAGISDDLDDIDSALAEARLANEIAAHLGGPLASSAELARSSILAERGDRSAVSAARRGLALLPDDVPEGHRQSVAANAALAAWRVGDVDAGESWLGLASGLWDAGPSIARAQLALAAAGFALLRNDPVTASEHAGVALDDLRGIGADRELALAASLASRAAIDVGDIASATEHARTAVAAASATGLSAPVAEALESVVRVSAASKDRDALSATVAALRAAGRRPAPPRLGVTTSDALPLATAQALEIASRVLG